MGPSPSPFIPVRRVGGEKLIKDEEAVSPVIGVILMVAITVVLAAVVFVLVQDLADVSESAPALSITERSGNLTIRSISSEVLWSDLTVTGCTGVPTNGTVDPGDKITGCSGEVVIVHEPSRSVIYQREI